MNLCSQINIELNESIIPDRYLNNDVAMNMIKDEIKTMIWEINQSEKGTRSGVQVVNPENGQGYLKNIDTSTKSTFPPYLQEIFNNSGTAKKFIASAKSGKGKVWERIAVEAIRRLENGYQNHHGYDMPNQDFIDIVKNPLPF